MKTCVFCSWPLTYDFTRQQWYVDGDNIDMLSTFVYECTYNECMTKTHRPIGSRDEVR